MEPDHGAHAAAGGGAGAQLLSTLALMFFGALISGCLPFFMRVRESHLQAMSALGAGLLMGSALAVIVPEGFHAFAQVRGVRSRSTGRGTTCSRVRVGGWGPGLLWAGAQLCQCVGKTQVGRSSEPSGACM